MVVHYFSLEDVLLLHFKLIEDFGGSHGVRSDDRLQSLVLAPRQEVFGEKLYPTVFERAAVYLRGAIADHPFIDGNKRTGVTLAAIYLMRNHYDMTATPTELEDFAVQVAVDTPDIPHIAAWLKAHSDRRTI